MTRVIRSRRTILPNGIGPASVHVADGRITRVAAWEDVPDVPDGAALRDAGDDVLMPGLVDTHVHVNDPGRAPWEGFETATRAAAAGGVTTILDMPLNAVPATTTVAALDAKRQVAEGRSRVRVEFIGGVVPGNAGELAALRDAGVRAFKCFLAPSGVDEFAHVTADDLRVAFPVLARLGLPLMVHAEDPACLLPAPAGGSRSHAEWLGTRPAAAERAAIAALVRLMEKRPTPVHVVHLSSATSLPIIAEARARGLPLTVETCPHYLTFASEEVADGAVEYKCAPPIRGRDEREALWEALFDGAIDLVASDHSPCPPDLKGDGDFFAAWGGIASLQLSLAATWTGARARGASVARIAEWMSAAPARLAGLHGRRGAIAPGYDADLVVWKPDARFVVEPRALHHRHKLTPYAGRELYGVVTHTYVGGDLVHAHDASVH